MRLFVTKTILLRKIKTKTGENCNKIDLPNVLTFVLSWRIMYLSNGNNIHTKDSTMSNQLTNVTWAVAQEWIVEPVLVERKPLPMVGSSSAT